jgi:hypothetical protein
VKEKVLPSELCLEVLRRLQIVGVLQELLLIGSWCVYFYENHFQEKGFLSPLRTRDIDFLVESPNRLSHEADVPMLLEDLGFLRDLYDEGYTRLVHPDLLIDFLVPRHGNAPIRPVPIKALGVNATALNFMDILLQHVIFVKIKDLTLRLPHPVNFAFHKLLISGRRRDPGKTERDRKQAIEVLDAAIAHGDELMARQLFRELPRKRRATILREFGRAKRVYPFTAK